MGPGWKEGGGAGEYGQSVGRRLSFSLGRHETVFQAEIYAILACVYEIQLQNRSEKYVSALIVKRPWKLLRPSEQRLLWSNSAKMRWMTSVPGMRWGYTGFLSMLEYEEMRSPMSSQGVALVWGSRDLSRSLGSLHETYKTSSIVGWLNRIGQGGEVLAIPKGRLGN
jgi:hypothetical protein